MAGRGISFSESKFLNAIRSAPSRDGPDDLSSDESSVKVLRVHNLKGATSHHFSRPPENKDNASSHSSDVLTISEKSPPRRKSPPVDPTEKSSVVWDIELDRPLPDEDASIACASQIPKEILLSLAQDERKDSTLSSAHISSPRPNDGRVEMAHDNSRFNQASLPSSPAASIAPSQSASQLPAPARVSATKKPSNRPSKTFISHEHIEDTATRSRDRLPRICNSPCLTSLENSLNRNDAKLPSLSQYRQYFPDDIPLDFENEPSHRDHWPEIPLFIEPTGLSTEIMDSHTYFLDDTRSQSADCYHDEEEGFYYPMIYEEQIDEVDNEYPEDDAYAFDGFADEEMAEGFSPGQFEAPEFRSFEAHGFYEDRLMDVAMDLDEYEMPLFVACDDEGAEQYEPAGDIDYFDTVMDGSAFSETSELESIAVQDPGPSFSQGRSLLHQYANHTTSHRLAPPTQDIEQEMARAMKGHWLPQRL